MSICVDCLLAILILTFNMLSGVNLMPVSVDPVCTATSTAKYSLTFTGKWSQTSFPKHYPLYRPPAQWSPLFGELSALFNWIKNGIKMLISHSFFFVSVYFVNKECIVS